VVGRQNADIADTLHLRDVAMATTFWLSVGYNLGCMIASDTLPDCMGGFLGSSYPIKTANFKVLTDVAVAIVFGFLYMGCTFAPLGEYD